MWVRQEEEIAQPFICQLLLPFVSHLLFHLPPKTEGLKHAKIPNNDRILFWERYEDFQFFTDSLNLVRDFGHFSGPWVSFILTPKPIFGFSYLWWLKRVPTQFKKVSYHSVSDPYSMFFNWRTDQEKETYPFALSQTLQHKVNTKIVYWMARMAPITINAVIATENRTIRKNAKVN